jgi:nitrite reductase/ring-hydroxylating ferredoxin subunit
VAKHRVATVEELPPGQRKLVEIAGRSIGIFNINGEYFALRNSCPHQGGTLCKGRLTGFLTARVPGDYTYLRRGEFLRCPWHGWEFDVKTGQSWFDPARTRVRTYPVSVEREAGTVEAECNPTAEAMAGLEQGPYMAETYVVSVEKEWVVVEVP